MTAQSQVPHIDDLPPETPERLQSEFSFYNAGSTRHLKRFQRWKNCQLVAGAAIPLCAVLIPPGYEQTLRATTAVLGAFVAAVESHMQFRQYHQNWIRWRTAAESLRREAFLFYRKAGQYKSAAEPEVLLAENVEEIVAIEQSSWRSLQENPHPAREKGNLPK